MMKMMQKENILNEFTEAQKVRIVDHFVLYLLFILGIGSVINFGVWWFQEDHISSGWLFGLLSLIIWYGIARAVFEWFTFAHIKKPEKAPLAQKYSVAIFTTSYKGEPLEMLRKTLEACKNIRYPHTTYLLDNTEDPAFAKVAEQCGAVWIESLNIPGAKAGKVNRALSQTDEDIILILDPDHIPRPDFFEHVLGYFSDPQVGFVQVSQGYYNQFRSAVAMGAAQQTYSFYGATQMGYHGMGCAIAIGANCTFRRAALESIGGHVVGLAEDLQTSLQLHAKGWKSVYNPVVVNRGIVPEDFNSFAKQQLKWAFGTFGFIYSDLPQVFSKLTFLQKLTYLSIASYYFSGFASLILMLIPFIFYISGELPVDLPVSEFLLHGLWIMLTTLLYQIYVQKWMCHPKTERGFHWQAMVLKFASWPVLLYGLLLALGNVSIPYVPTAKRAEQKMSVFAKPLWAYVAVFVVFFAGVFVYRRYFIGAGSLVLSSSAAWLMSAFAFMVFIATAVALVFIRSPRKVPDSDPWNDIDLYKP